MRRVRHAASAPRRRPARGGDAAATSCASSAAPTGTRASRRDRCCPRSQGRSPTSGSTWPRRRTSSSTSSPGRTKSPRAFCAPIEVPERVDARDPADGRAGRLARALPRGRARRALRAHVSPDLPVEARRLGDNSVTEGWAMLFEQLVDDPAWLVAPPRLRPPATTSRQERRPASSTSCAATRRSSCTSWSSTRASSSSRCATATSSCSATRRRSSRRRPTTSPTSTRVSTLVLRALVGVRGADRSSSSARSSARAWFTRREAGSLLRELWARGTAAHRGRAAPRRDRIRARSGSIVERSKGASAGMRRVVIAGAAGRDFHNFNVAFRGSDDVRGRRLHRHADPRHRRPRLPARAGRGPATRTGSRSSPRRSWRTSIAPRGGRRGRLRLLGRLARARHAHRLAGAGRRRRLPARSGRARPSSSSDQARGRDLRRAHRLGQEPDDAPRRRASSARPASASPCCATRCPTAISSKPGGAALRDATRTSTPHDCTIEEREEYEPHLAEGNLVFAGVDYGAILARGRGGGRRDPLGRRQQRHAVHPARTCTSSSSIRTARGTSSATTRARRTCAWPTSASSTSSDTAPARGRRGRARRRSPS